MTEEQITAAAKTYYQLEQREYLWDKLNPRAKEIRLNRMSLALEAAFNPAQMPPQ